MRTESKERSLGNRLGGKETLVARFEIPTKKIFSVNLDLRSICFLVEDFQQEKIPRASVRRRDREKGSSKTNVGNQRGSTPVPSFDNEQDCEGSEKERNQGWRLEKIAQHANFRMGT